MRRRGKTAAVLIRRSIVWGGAFGVCSPSVLPRLFARHLLAICPPPAWAQKCRGRLGARPKVPRCALRRLGRAGSAAERRASRPRWERTVDARKFALGTPLPKGNPPPGRYFYFKVPRQDTQGLFSLTQPPVRTRGYAPMFPVAGIPQTPRHILVPPVLQIFRDEFSGRLTS